MNALTVSEQTQLVELETTIERGLNTFYEVGNALLKIRDSRLYRAAYPTFEAYCQERWKMERAQAYRLIDASEVRNNLAMSPIGDKILPATESQARPLSQLPPSQQSTVWQQVVETVGNGKITAKDVEQAVKSQIKRKEKEQKREQKSEDKAYTVPTGKSLDQYCLLLTEDIRQCTLEDASVDIIITDPPYPEMFLPLYGELARVAARVLKPGGSLVVMIGQSYLPDVLSQMIPFIRYHWMLSYLTPGGKSVQLWQRKVNTFWKPLLWFVNGEYTGDWLGDVTRSEINANDKRFHHWGQSESGMADIIERFTYPGQIIFDPFCGGGTTGVVAVAMERFFIGADVSPQCMGVTEHRISKVIKPD